MQKKLMRLVLALLMVIGGQVAMAQSSADCVAGVVRVKLQREVAVKIASLPQTASVGVQSTGITQFDRVNNKVKAVSMKRLIPYSPKFEAEHRAAGLDLWYEIRFDETAVKPAEARALYSAVPGIQIAENVHPVKPIGGESFRVISNAEMAKAQAVAKANAATPFNDPLLGQQWHYYNDGKLLTGSVKGADANIWNAWTVETGKSDVLVAIVDGGFQVDHPDLEQAGYINEAELNGKAGTDDDGNGYVDDIYGWNFVVDSNDVSAHAHGTHVAGTVGAINNNGIGVAGVAGGNGDGGVKMLRCQVFDSRAESTSGNYAAALVYAADMNASIAQCSWGWAYPDTYEQNVIDAIDYFTSKGGGNKMNGGLCIFANGNTGEQGNYWPACYDKVLSVGAIDPMLRPASYSTYGTWCDVSAPGGDLDFGEKYGVLSTLPNSTYGYNNGTSMACPHVSGIAALVLSKFGSNTFTNENLRMQLVSAVNDLYTSNPGAEGLFGSGYIDGYKAMQMGTGEAPAAITDFTLTPSSDNVLVEWIIPDTPEKSVDHHIFYYSTEEFTADTDVNTLKFISLDTKFNVSGDAMSYEITGLQPTTTYYIAIVAVNRYGASSALSPVKSATTNEGPKVELDKNSLTLAIDATSSKTAQGEFTITNNGLGVLKWNLSAATTKFTVSSYGVSSPNPGRIVPASGDYTAQSVSNYPVVAADYKKEDYPKTIVYSPTTTVYLGESDKTLPNAMAQYFFVDSSEYPDGFNLTALQIGGYGGTDPVIEIYDGASTISKASLLQTIEYSWFVYDYDMNLNEQIHFAPGTGFWVVVKFAAGFDYPLGAGLTTEDTHKNYSFYSSDNGETWTQLSEILREGNYASQAELLNWKIIAKSKNPDWSSVLTPTPIEGTVRPGESQVVTVENDGQTLVNGTYKFNLYVNTNEVDNPKQPIAIDMTVAGYEPALTSEKMIDFGNILVGEKKTLSIELVNDGFGVFGGNYGYMYPNENMSSDSDQFSVPSYMEGIAARSSSTIDITFAPTKSGSHSGNITLTSKSGVTHTFVVRGVAAMPAKIVVEQDSFDFGDLEVGGESKTATISLKNEGEYPLEYAFPKFSAETVGDAGKVHKFGYTYTSNINGSDGFEYDGNPELSDEVDITKQFNDNNWQSSAIDLGFKFPFYGTDYTQVYVTSQGSVEMQLKDGNIGHMVVEAQAVKGLGYISAYGNSGTLQMGANSKVAYGHYNGKFIVKFENVITGSAMGSNQPISFHMALCPDGSVEVYYDDYNPRSVWDYGRNIYIGVCDIPGEDAFTITDVDCADEVNIHESICTGSAIKIHAPSKSIISSLSSVDGIIGIGQSKEITVTVLAEEGHYAGALTNVLTMLTNDPETPGVNFLLSANIIGESLKPIAETNLEVLDFGEVFRTSTAVKNILLSNNGSDKLNVASVVVKDGKFTVAEEYASAFVVDPGTSKELPITLPTEVEGAVEDVVEITLSNESIDPITIDVKGTVIGTPQWDINVESIEATTDYGVDVETSVVVTNNGNEDLKFTIVPNSVISVKDNTIDETTSIDYVYKSGTDYSEITCEWIDLVSDPDAVHQDMTYYLDKTDFYTVELPFEFPFYGKNYSTMYIYNTGFVSFSEHTDYKMFPEPPASIPTTDTFYTNIIAPFWGNHTMGSTSEDGTYYKSYGDYVVVSFVNYGNSVTWGMDFQVILYKDGSYKFQYHLQDGGQMLGVFGLAGIQDETATRGINLPSNCINSGNAVEFYPTKSYTVAKDGGNVEIALSLPASKMAEVYTSNLVFNTNVPSQPVVEIPVSLTINGEIAPIFPEIVGGEAVADPINWPTVIYDFQVQNLGTKAFKIVNVGFNQSASGDGGLDDGLDDNMGVGGGTGDIPAQLWVYTTYTDYWTGSLTTGWTPYESGMELTVGREPAKFQIWLQDIGVPASYQDWITFTIDTCGDGYATVQVPFSAMFTPAPVLSFDKPAIELTKVASDYIGSEKVTISNAGEWTLQYSLYLDPTGIGEQVEDMGDDPGIAPLNNVIADAANAKVVLAEKTSIVPNEKFEGWVWDVPDMDCNNLLYYPILDVPNPGGYLIGAGNAEDNFYAATQYTAPDAGFNLTHLYFAATIGSLENVDIEATVISGTDVTSDYVIGHGKLRVEKENSTGGEARLLKFDHPVYINANETFYVVLKLPAGDSTTAAWLTAKEDKVVEGRFMAWFKDDGWTDLGVGLEQTYGSLGYCMTCVEEVPGQPWITLDSSSVTEGTIAVGESVDVTVNVNAASSRFDDNNVAMLVIKSNDPTQKVVNYPIYMTKNAAPEITVPTGTFTVAEGETAQLSVEVSDAEGDEFSVTVENLDNIASLYNFTTGNPDAEAEEVEGVINVPAGETLTLTILLAPDYGTSGYHSVTVNATDANNNYRTETVTYYVEHSNRAPEYIGATELAITVGTTSAAFNFVDMFTEPDGEELTFSVASDDSSVATIYASNSGFVVMGAKLGSANVTVTATDESGASVDGTIEVNVVEDSGVDEINADNKDVSVATDNDIAVITTNTFAHVADYFICDVAGRLVAQLHGDDVLPGESKSVRLKTATVYFLIANLDGNTVTVKFSL